MNEEIGVVLHYISSVNVDLLSFSGTISYKDEVVGIIKFDYIQLRFQIWNYFSDFKRDQTSFQIRFNVFNPQYYMPSIFLRTLKMNFPPNNCKLSINPNLNVFSIETKIFMQFSECEDENYPIYYQFFYYQTSDDFEHEKKNPLQVKRRQLNDKQQNHYYQTSLPSGDLLILAQAIDSKSAVFNSTYKIHVQQKQYDEQTYLSLIQQKIDQVDNQQVSIAISELSIVCDDMIQRIQFKQSSLLNSKKIEILDLLISLQKKISSLSTLSTIADKAIASLIKSEINFDQSKQTDFINKLIIQLENSSILQQSNLEVSKERLKQKLYDNFQFVDSLRKYESNKQVIDKIIELNDKVSFNLFQNILPNEDPVIYRGEKVNLLGTQITEKYICSYFLCEESNPTDSLKQPSIYNYKKSEYLDNPYSQDESFLNYTKQLKEKNPEQEISSFKVITPQISNYENSKIESFPKQTILNFPNPQQNSDSKKMACLSKDEKNGWVKDNCKNIYNQIKNQYVCICQSLSPTTVIDDLEELLENENINTAFSSEGISNISNFKDFYKYVAFWVLFIKSMAFVLFYLVGQKKDKFDFTQKLDKIRDLNIDELLQDKKTDKTKNKIYPQASFQNQIQEQSQSLKDQKENQNYAESINASPHFNSTENQNINSPISKLLFKKNSQITDDLNIIDLEKDTPKKSLFYKKTQTTESINIIDLDKDSPQLKSMLSKNNQTTENMKIIDLDNDTQDNQKYQKDCILQEDEKSTMPPQSPQIQSIDLDEENRNKAIYSPRIHSSSIFKLQANKQLLEKNNSFLLKEKQSNYDVGSIAESNNKDQDDFNIENNHENDSIKLQNDNTSITNKRDTDDQSKQIQHYFKGFNMLSRYKQVAIFYNFFGIFWIFNPNMSRALRFFIFYVRSIHSLGISVIFDQNYSIVQQIFIAIINSLIIAVFIKIFEYGFSYRKIIGKIIGRTVITSILLGYYYIILSIVSGKTAYESNQFFGLYLLFYFGDIYVISVISAIIQRLIALHIIKKQQIKGIFRLLFKLIQLKLVLISTI